MHQTSNHGQPDTNGPALDDAHLEGLVSRLRQAEEELQGIAAGQVDAVLDPVKAAPILFREAQDALAESEARYRHLMERVVGLVFELGPDGTTLFVNDAVVEITGYGPAELQGRDWWRTLFPGRLRRVAARLRRKVLSGDVTRYPVTIATREGREAVLELNTANRYDAEGHLERLVGFATDVTERKRMEDALRDASARLERKVEERTSELRRINRELSREIAERKHAEEERERLLDVNLRQRAIAQQQAEELEAMLRSAASPVLALGADRILVRANQKAAELFGFPPEQMSWPDFVARLALRLATTGSANPADLPLDRSLQGETVVDERLVFTDARGAQRIVSASSAPVLVDGHIAEAVAVWHDVTELEHARAEAQRHADEVDAVFDALTESVMVFDAEGHLVRTNPAAMRAYGVDPRGLDWTEHVRRLVLLDVDGRPLDEQSLPSMRALRGETVAAERSFYTDASGQRRTALASAAPVYVGGRIAGAVVVWRDTTEEDWVSAERERLLKETEQERQRTEALARALRDERDTLEIIMENTHAQLAYLDPQFRFVRVNSAYAENSGYTKEELIGRDHFDLFPNEENQTIFARVRDTGLPVRFAARPFSYADQPERGVTYWDWSLVPMVDRDGNVQGLVFSLLDVTGRERARMEREEHLSHLNRLFRVSQQILEETSVDGVLGSVVHTAAELTGSRLGVAGHLNHEGAFHVTAAQCADDRSPCLDDAWFAARQRRALLDMLRKTTSVRLTHEEIAQSPGWGDLAFGRGLLGARLTDRQGQAVGLVIMSDKQQGEYTDEDEAVLSQLASLASLGLQHIEARLDAERRADELDGVFSAYTDVVLVYNADGLAIRANPAAVRFFGVDPVGMSRESLTELCGTREWSGRALSVSELPSERALRGETVVGETIRVRDAAGREAVTVVSAAPIHVGDQIVGAVIVWHDITERRRMEEDLRQARDELESRVRERTIELSQANTSLQAEIAERLQAEEELQRRNRELAVLNMISAAASSSLDLSQFPDTLRRVFTELVQVSGGALVTYEEETDTLALLVSWRLPDKLVHALHGLPARALYAQRELTEGQEGLVAAPRRVRLSNIVPGYSDEPPYALSIPLLSERSLQGALILLGADEAIEKEERHAFLGAMAQQIGVALQNAQLYAQVRDASERLQALSQRLVEVQELERRAIARELHDEVGQVLTGIRLSLEMAGRLPEDEVAESLMEARARVNELVAQVRQLSLDLRPAMLDDLGLLPALLWQIERYTSRFHVHIQFQHSGLDRRFPPEIETAAYRIVQEALTNVARHAHTQEAMVRVWADGDTLNIQVEDRGIGFDPQAAEASRLSSGLVGMHERATLLGGRFLIESSPSVGTRLTAELPLERQSKEKRGQT